MSLTITDSGGDSITICVGPVHGTRGISTTGGEVVVLGPEDISLLIEALSDPDPSNN